MLAFPVLAWFGTEGTRVWGGSQVEGCVPSALSGSFGSGWNEAKSKGCVLPLTSRSADSPLTCYTGRVRICRGLKTQSH